MRQLQTTEVDWPALLRPVDCLLRPPLPNSPHGGIPGLGVDPIPARGFAADICGACPLFPQQQKRFMIQDYLPNIESQATMTDSTL